MKRVSIDTALTASSISAVLAIVTAAACASPTIPGFGNGRDEDPTSPGSKRGDGGATSGAPTRTGLPCDVDKVLKTKCQACHGASPSAGASTSLVTYADLQKTGPGGAKVADLVKERIQDAARPMPPGALLPPADRAPLDAWFAAGAPESDAECDNGEAPSGTKPLSCKPDFVLKGSRPYAMPAGKVDEYVCVGVDVNLAKKRHVIGMAPKVDNAKILHHILLFKTKKAVPNEPTPCGAFNSAGLDWTLVTGWAPGGGNMELPPEAGYAEEVGTTHWVLQFHYNNAANAPNQADNSGFEFCTTEELRPNDAGIVAFGSINFSIPPRATHKIKCDHPLGPQFAGVTFFSASPHMHTAGASMSTERVPKLGLGKPEMVFADNAFNFEKQEHHPIRTSVAPGDIMRTRCAWKNPTDSVIGFGEGTGDEMCFHFMAYYPDKQVPWVMPSVLTKCSVE
ncbi:MAG: peptidylglycine alpha-amidating monooxygenase [Labilithrix sp.]|nr:peptidylglycine alpha-amidating monooxygenase [Labilithrix sp.]